MRGKIVLGFVLMLLVLQVASAIETTATIKTLRDAEVTLNGMTMGGETMFKATGTADEYGDLELTFDATGTFYKILTYAKQEDYFVPKEFNNLIPGEDQYLEILPEGIPPLHTPNQTKIIETNETEETNQTQDIPENNTVIGTGKAILGGINFSQMGYVLLAVILLAAAFLLGFKIKSKNKKKEIKVTKLSDKKKEEDDKEEKDVELEEAEKKLEEAQQKIKDLKEGKGKSEKEKEIEEAKKKLIEDEKRLMKLREDK